ncbi:hypothetical protein LIA77_05802 [Sarocladium implicatum]|nr:hypothetical protein LIA77_05802 [Sarocladium implicatum]
MYRQQHKLHNDLKARGLRKSRLAAAVAWLLERHRRAQGVRGGCHLILLVVDSARNQRFPGPQNGCHAHFRSEPRCAYDGKLVS